MNKVGLSITMLGFLLPLHAFAAGKSLRVKNLREAFPIWQVYITPAGQGTWNKDQLGGAVIAAGESYTWTIPWDGCYVDVKAVTFTGLSAEAREINVCGGGEWSVYDTHERKTEIHEKQEKSIRIVNNRQQFPIWKVFITQAGERTWGPDRLNDEVIDVGYSKSWTIPWNGCNVDLKASTFTGISVENRNVNVCGGFVWTLSD